MKAKKLKEFINKTNEKRLVITTINIEKSQLDFIKNHDINLSKLIRAYLDSIVEGVK